MSNSLAPSRRFSSLSEASLVSTVSDQARPGVLGVCVGSRLDGDLVLKTDGGRSPTSAVAEAQVILVDNRVVGRSTGVAPENVTTRPSACAEAIRVEANRVANECSTLTSRRALTRSITTR